jgi:Reverse transcriptase (RNA-dependent DNA polymerase)/Reverse transcriptase-like
MRAGFTIEVEWRDKEDTLTTTTPTTSSGEVIRVNGTNGKVIVDYGGEIGQLPFPPNERYEVFTVNITARHKLAGVPNIMSVTNYNFEKPHRIIYSGGMCTSGRPSGAASIIEIAYPTLRHTSTHSKHIPQTTATIADAVALLAAVKLAKRNQSMPTMILCSSVSLANHIIDRKPSTNKDLKSTYEQIILTLATMMDHVTVAHIQARENLAITEARRANVAAMTTGDTTLFIEPPMPRRTNPPRTVQSTEQVVISTSIADSIHTLDDFAKLRRLKSRTRCPQAATPAWAILVKNILSKISTAPTAEGRDRAMIELICLPMMYLPAGVPTKRIETHTQRGQPFNIREPTRQQPEEEETEPNADAQPQQNVAAAAAASASATSTPNAAQKEAEERKQNERLGKAVTRLALDRKIKSAVKLLQQKPATDDMEKKLQDIRSKFIPRQQLVHKLTTTNTVSYDTATVITVAKKLPRNAVNCIDGWTKDLLLQTINIDASIAEHIGVLAARINDEGFGELVMSILKAGRVVGIPKSEGNYRPIVISSFFVKLTGALVLFRAKSKCSKRQYALDIDRGAERIVHLTREAYAVRKTIIRIDSSNAFNMTQRERIGKLLHQQPDEMKAYFNTMYVKSTPLFMYGPNGTMHVIDAEEGVRQGDALSSFFFCLMMDEAMKKISEKHPDADIWCYMDDMTIAVLPHMAGRVFDAAKEALKELGFQINAEKSAAIQIDNIQTANITNSNPTEEFKMLGANITSNYIKMNKKKEEDLETFFHNIVKCNLHPQLQWTILRLCGMPKMIYYAATTPPMFSSNLLDTFDKMVKTTAQTILEADIAPRMFYDTLGGGFPLYAKIANDLFEASKTMSLAQTKGAYVQLVTSCLSTAALSSQHDAQYLFFQANTDIASMSPKEFQMAMSIRLRVLPRHIVNRPRKCNCGATLATDDTFIEHVLTCDQSTRFTHTHRHNQVRDAIAAVARANGITVTVEPTFYNYSTAARKRPDITFHTPKPIATDVTIVKPHEVMNKATEDAEQAKSKEHTEAVSALGHTFIPFAMEVYGHRGISCTTLTKALKNQLPRHLQWTFEMDMNHAVSSALAKARAQSILSAVSNYNDIGQI